MWVLAVILIVALLIPVAAILVDSPLGRSVAGMRDEVQFVQRLLEDPHRKKPTS